MIADTLKVVTDGLALLPLENIHRKTVEMIQEQVKLKVAEVEASRLEVERLKVDNHRLREELVELQGKFAGGILADEYETHGVVAHRKGSQQALCPNCFKVLGKVKGVYSCVGCKWQHDVPFAGGAYVTGGKMPGFTWR